MYIKGNAKKKEFIKEIFYKFKRDKNIISATFVGSFVDKHSLKNWTDTDPDHEPHSEAEIMGE